MCFRKIFIFPTDFNDFMQLWGELVATLLALGNTLGLLGVYAGDFGSLLGQFWAI